MGQKQVPQTRFAGQRFEFFHNFGGNPRVASGAVGGNFGKKSGFIGVNVLVHEGE